MSPLFPKADEGKPTNDLGHLRARQRFAMKKRRGDGLDLEPMPDDHGFGHAASALEHVGMIGAAQLFGDSLSGRVVYVPRGSRIIRHSTCPPLGRGPRKRGQQSVCLAIFIAFVMATRKPFRFDFNADDAAAEGERDDGVAGFVKSND